MSCSGYENQTGTPSEIGATHLLELNAFRSTQNRTYQEVHHGVSECVHNILLRSNVRYFFLVC
jgi:hypothetical protein